VSENNRQWILKRRPVGRVETDDFELRSVPAPEPADGELLVRNLWLSFDPTQRGWLQDRPSYLPPVQIGEVMRASTVGQVVRSRHPDFEPGEFVFGLGGWQDLFTCPGGSGLIGVRKVPAGVPPSWLLGVLGVTGATAYFGLLELGRPQAGQTVVVSGAAGATGSVAGQIARLRGCRVVGIAGGPDKCRWVTERARFDACIDYKHDDVGKRLGELCPNGVDVYFDNVGGSILEVVLDRLALRARIVLCGSIASYNDVEPRPGPRNLSNLVVRRARMEGFIVLDYLARMDEAVRELLGWVRAGEIVHEEDIQHGFENIPATLNRLFTGENLGKQLLQLGEPVQDLAG
jgi:NADPH-dependent curcumin reductase CurA